jgi:putative selenate reductase
VSLAPYPLAALLRRAFRELETRDALFDLPARRFYRPSPRHDVSARFHGHRVATPFGPAAGPHSQLAQNIALAWAAGGRVIELKTVQVRDDLVIPRPCIDMQTVGYNVEWSQELRVEQSLEEYIKAAMLVRILAASGLLPASDTDVVFDISVGYDLAGIRSEKVAGFIDGLRDAAPAIDRLRAQIPAELARFRDLDFPTRLADTLTLSTFHGCPPGEIERIVEHLVERHGLHCVVKLNPMLLGPGETRRLLNEVLGYHEIRVPQSAFDRDTTWDQMCGLVQRLGAFAGRAGRGFGVKLTNTLIVENHRDVLPASEREMYLSGPPLHVLAIEIARRFRAEFGDRFPLSFSAGIDAANFADGVALGFTPVTACTDLLKPGGYGRAAAYFARLAERMDAAGAASLEDFVIRAYGLGGASLDTLAPDPAQRARCERALAAGGALRPAVGDDRLFDAWRSAAVRLNTGHYAARVAAEPRYAREANRRAPRKIGRHLRLFDCISCDKCIPVCPNDALFGVVVARGEYPVVKVTRVGGHWETRAEGTFLVDEAHQIATFADFCNDCGNCDVFCPEDGGPYVVKPRVHGSEAAWRASQRDGFFVDPALPRATVRARFVGVEYALEEEADGRVRYSGPGFSLRFDPRDPAGTLDGDATAGQEIDLSYSRIMLLVHDGLLAPGAVNYVSSLRP